VTAEPEAGVASGDAACAKEMPPIMTMLMSSNALAPRLRTEGSSHLPREGETARCRSVRCVCSVTTDVRLQSDDLGHVDRYRNFSRDEWNQLLDNRTTPVGTIGPAYVPGCVAASWRSTEPYGQGSAAGSPGPPVELNSTRT